LKEKEVTYTSFSANRQSYPLLKRFGFEDYFSKYALFPAINARKPRDKTEVIFDRQAIMPYLDAGNKKIMEDHGVRAEAFLIIADQRCLCVFTKVKKKGLSFGLLHYISDKECFRAHIASIKQRIAQHYRVKGLLVFKEYLGNEKVKGAVVIASPSKGVFRSDRIDREQLDSLYSEFFVLP